jgi:hypothetical protein
VAEGIKVLTAQAPDLRAALTRVAQEGWSHVILDGKLLRTDRVADAIQAGVALTAGGLGIRLADADTIHAATGQTVA